MLFMLTETSEFMMSFVIQTKKGNLIVVDGAAGVPHALRYSGRNATDRAIKKRVINR